MVFIPKNSHKDTKKEKITKKREEGGVVSKLSVGLHDMITNNNPLFPFVIFSSFVSLCEPLPSSPLFFVIFVSLCLCVNFRELKVLSAF
jgi:hypothetical protein